MRSEAGTRKLKNVNDNVRSKKEPDNSQSGHWL